MTTDNVMKKYRDAGKLIYELKFYLAYKSKDNQSMVIAEEFLDDLIDAYDLNDIVNIGKEELIKP